jgi:HlyD family secretion protein
MVGNIPVQQRAAVTPNQPLLTVVDLSVFEIELSVPSFADDLALDAAEITYGNSSEGRLTSISPRSAHRSSGACASPAIRRPTCARTSASACGSCSGKPMR